MRLRVFRLARHRPPDDISWQSWISPPAPSRNRSTRP
jgi:hypothetical protein